MAAARLAADTRCHHVTVLDVSAVSPLADFFVIATGTSGRQMRTVADDLKQLGKESGYTHPRMDGYDSASWVLVDFVDVVVHLFTEDARQYYDLDNLWGDAPRTDLSSNPSGAPAPA